MQRRTFLESVVLGQTLLAFQNTLNSTSSPTDYWLEIRNQFPISKTDHINLNNGSCGMMPIVVEESMIQFAKEMNRMPPYIQNEIWTDLIAQTLDGLAQMIGVKVEEISITRNTTESLQWLIDGIVLPKNSTIVCAEHDYTLAVNAMQSKSESSALKLNKFEVDLPNNPDSIIAAYEEAIDENCSLVLLTAMTHREGHRIPIKEITAIAHKYGAKVIVDGAHCIGHFNHNVNDWNCDFYATSLHKWFNGPHGTGLMYIKESEIEKIEGPLAADLNTKSTKRKFEYLGTRAFYIEASILSALIFNNGIGIDNKFQRLNTLTQYWAENAGKIEDVEVSRSNDSGGIATVNIKGIAGGTIKNIFKESKIYVKRVAAKMPKTASLRITPGIYTNYNDLNVFIEKLEKIVKER